MGGVPERAVRMAVIDPGGGGWCLLLCRWGRCCDDGAGEVGGRGRAGGWSHVRDVYLYPQSRVKPWQCLKSGCGFGT